MLLGSLGCAATATGCLVAEAPEYGPPQQRPPVVDWTGAITPSPYDLFVVDDDTPTVSINVPFRSEDAGDDILGALYLDLSDTNRPGQSSLIIQKRVPASSYDDLNRSWSLNYTPDVTDGCGHVVTLLLTHESNFDSDLFAPKASASWDIASVSWRLNVRPEDPDFIAICPSPEGTAP
jgi:hypothetical protein